MLCLISLFAIFPINLMSASNVRVNIEVVGDLVGNGQTSAFIMNAAGADTMGIIFMNEKVDNTVAAMKRGKYDCVATLGAAVHTGMGALQPIYSLESCNQFGIR